MSTSVKPAHHTPTSLNDGSQSSTPKKSANPATAAALALNMSWQLLVVIVLPLLGGYLLDNKLHSGHTWMVVGMVVALAAMIMVVRQTLIALNEVNGTMEDDK